MITAFPVTNAAGDPLIGRTIAQYEVVARLGGGGMGVVYAARDTRLGRRVALKFLPPQWSHDEGARQRFVREAQAASSTDHRNICTIHDIATGDDGQLFIVMAHYEGVTLKDRLESGPLSVDEAVEIAAQVAEGLAKAHAQGVIHRDVKPGNLMLTEDGVKILDFGLAKFAEARLKLTLEGSTIGTVAYMSPEQARGEEADARSDVWAIGVVLYEMLAGTPPFKGGYPEAIAHAIKTDPPSPLRGSGEAGPIPEALEQLVFRALHKNPAVRFQTARDLARALRVQQGRTIPLDLRTEPVPTAGVHAAGIGRSSGWQRRALVAAGVLAAIALAGAAWILAPVDRVFVAVAPVVNQTGYAELDPYRLALTQELIAGLQDSAIVRPLRYEQLLHAVRPFRDTGRDVSSREALQAITGAAGPELALVPTLVHEDNAWRARIEVIPRGASAPSVEIETAAVTSSLPKDAVYALMAQLAGRVGDHFTAAGPRRAYVASVLRAGIGSPLRGGNTLRSLDAAAVFASGLDAYEQQEHSTALRAFSTAADEDSTNALPAAWRSRVARLMGQSRVAEDAAAEARRRDPTRLRTSDRLFVEAVIAEAGRDAPTAEARYRELIERYPDEAMWQLELGAFLDRQGQGRYRDAEAGYTAALGLDATLTRARLELCRLYGPARLNDPPNARRHGEEALAAYRRAGGVAGEAQARWCLADVLNVGDASARAEAMRHAEAARDLLERRAYPFNLSRAYNYLALSSGVQGRFTDAAVFWEQSLAQAREAGNVTLEPVVLTNLSVVHERLGNIARAVEFRRQGAALAEALGDEQRAAQNQANGALLMIEYGIDPEQGFRDVQNALGVVRKLGDRNFEVFCLRVLGLYHRYAGRSDAAAQEINRAISIASERNLDEDVAEARLDLARVRFDTSDYAGARALLEQAIPSALDSVEALIYLARVQARAGNVAAAEASLARASTTGDSRVQLAPLLNLARGELAYEAGRTDDARRAFASAAAAWTEELPHEASVEARAYIGLLDGLAGRTAQGAAALRASLDRARAMGRHALAARCGLYLARIDIGRGRFAEALRTLDEVPADRDGTTIGRELRAQVHHWRAMALKGLGDAAAADAERAAARKWIAEIGAALPVADRAAFDARPDIATVR